MRRLALTLSLAALTVAAVAWAQTGVTLNIGFADAAVYDEVEAAVCSHYGYQETTVANPEGRKAFVRRQAKKYLLDHRDAYLDSVVAQSARAAAKAARKAESDTP